MIPDLIKKAKNAYKIGDLVTAERIVNQVLSENPDYVPGLVLLGTIYSNRQEYPKAISQFKEALGIDPGNIESLNNLGVIYRRNGQYETALKLLQKTLSLQPNRADIYYNMGNIYKSQGNNEMAIDSYRKAITLAPLFILAYNNLATLYQKIGETEKGISVLKEGLKHDPNHPTLHYNIAIFHQNAGNLEEAAHNYHQALRSRPGWIDALNNLGIVYQNLKKYDESINTFKEIHQIDPQNARAANNLANVYEVIGRKKEAASCYRRALQSNPGYSRAAINLGHLLEEEGDIANALDDIENLIQRDPENIELRFQMAKILTYLSQYNEAEVHLRYINIKEPDNIKALHYLGCLYYRMDQKIKGKELHQKLHRIDPGYGHHFYDLAAILREKGEYDDAEKNILNYLNHHPGDLKSRIYLAEIKADQGNYSEASKILYRLKQEYPYSEEVMSSLAKLFHIVGQKESAIEMVDELVSLQGNRGDPNDITGLNDSLELYEKIVQTFEDEHSEEWERSLELLGKMVSPQIDTDKLDQSPELEGESIPVLDFMEEFEAEPEEMFPEEEEEEEEAEEISYQEPIPNLFTLLDDQKTNKRDIPSPSTQGSPQPPPYTPTQPPQSAPQAQQQPPPTPQQWPQPTSQAQQQPPPQYNPPTPPSPRQPEKPQPSACNMQSVPPQIVPPVFVANPQPSTLQYTFIPVDNPKPKSGRRAGDRPQEVYYETQGDRRKEPDRRSTTDRRSGKDRRNPTKPAPEYLYTEEGVVPFFERRNKERRSRSDRRNEGEKTPQETAPPLKEDQNKEKKEISPDKKIKLLDYLLELSYALPHEKRKEFIRTEIPLKIAMLKAQLSGKSGLKNEIEKITPHAGEITPVTIKKINDAFNYLGRMAMYHPDTRIGSILREKITSIMQRVAKAERNSQ